MSDDDVTVSNHHEESSNLQTVVDVISEMETVQVEGSVDIVKRPRRRHRSRYRPTMEQTTEVQIHDTPVKVHKSRSKPAESKSKPRSHSRHKCHKNNYKPNYPIEIQRRLDNSVTSLDSGVPIDLPPLDMHVTEAYQHLKTENDKLKQNNNDLKNENRNINNLLEKYIVGIRDKDGDILLLKNLVYRLNIELEKLQVEPEKVECVRNLILPEYYNKNFIKPILPLLKAYSEVILEKNDLINNYEVDFVNFSKTMKDILLENEKLYKELEIRDTSSQEFGFEEFKKSNSYLTQENKLINNQLELHREKLKQIQVLFKNKVTEILKENDTLNEQLQTKTADFYILQGKYSVLREEHERLLVEREQRVPLAVHSATVSECKRLFMDLKREYENEKQTLTHKLKMSETSQLEKCKKVQELEAERNSLELSVRTKKTHEVFDVDEVKTLQQMLRDSNCKRDETAFKLSTTKKQLHKAMSFAEDLVREQENLLRQLHAKQRENTSMVEHFGLLRNTIKSVEHDANEGLNSIEERLRQQESEKQSLVLELKKLKHILREKEELMDRTQDDTSDP